MEPFSIESDLTLADWQAYQSAVAVERRNVLSAWWLIVIVVALAVVWFTSLDFLSCVLGVAVTVLALAVYRWINLKATEPKERESFIGSCKYEFRADGMYVSSPGMGSSINWARVTQLTESKDHLYLWIDRRAAFVVPLRDLPDGMQREDAVARIQHWMTVSRDASDIARDEPVSEDAASGSLAAALFRLLTLRKANGSAISGSDRPILLLVILSLGLWTLIDRIRAGAGATFYPFGVTSFASIAIALIVLALVFARQSRPRIDFRRVLVVVLGFLPIAIVAIAAIRHYLPSWTAAGKFALCLYALVYSFKALQVLTGKRQLSALIMSMVVLGGFWILKQEIYLDTAIWYAPHPDKSESAVKAWQQSESLLFDQRARIDAAIEKIQRPAGTAPAFFFLGFAGVGEQKVFAEEIKLASKVVDRRYDTGGRSLLLINDRRDFTSQPLATVSGLRYALRQLAAKMNVERDVLFLSLSSHGSERPSLSVSNSSLPLKNVSGDDLASALHDSGIKWRVIVISACHAGAFIDYLRDPYTVIVTAAAADKTSFGCSDDRDITYFGEAFYRDALPQSKSLSEAFDAAKAAIAVREKQENVTPSDPQAYFGEELRRKLTE